MVGDNISLFLDVGGVKLPYPFWVGCCGVRYWRQFKLLPDAALIEAERELMAIQGGFKALGTHQYAYTVADPECLLISPQSGPAWQRFMELDRLIVSARAETIEGATVKLRRLDDSFFGLWMISETSWTGAVVNHHKRLLADALGVLGRGYGGMTGERLAS